METRGLIQVRQGKRPVVNGLDATMPGDFFHASEDGLRAMQETIDTMTAKSKARADDPIGFNDADAEFHQRLAAASGNRLGASQLLTRRV